MAMATPCISCGETNPRAFAPERIVLFGLYASGTARPESDINLLVVAEVQGNPELHLGKARQLVAADFLLVDVVLCTPEHLIAAQTGRSPFLLSVLESGITH
jgi:predicted nucleotidyltransferase